MLLKLLWFLIILWIAHRVVRAAGDLFRIASGRPEATGFEGRNPGGTGERRGGSGTSDPRDFASEARGGSAGERPGGFPGERPGGSADEPRGGFRGPHAGPRPGDAHGSGAPGGRTYDAQARVSPVGPQRPATRLDVDVEDARFEDLS